MKTWKAILALLLVACLFVTLFAACANNETPSTDQGATSGDKTPSSGNNDSSNNDSSNNDSNDTPATGDEELPGEETYAPEDYVDINIWMNSSMTNEEHINAVLEAVNAIIGPKIGVQIADVTMLGMGQYNSQIALAIANGEKIDLAACTPLPGSSMSALVANGSAMPYTEYAKEYAPEYLEMMAKMLPGLTFDGELYGITAYRQKSTNQYLWWKTEHAERLGIQDELLNMKTWADLDAIAPKILDEGFVLFGDKKCVYDGYYIMDPQNVASYGYESLGDGFRLIYAEGDKVGCLYENDDFVNSLKLFADWNAKGYIHPDTALNQETTGASYVKDDIMFFSLSASEFGGEATFENQAEAPVTVRCIGEGVLATIDAQVWSYFIPVTCEEPEATLKFVNEMYTNEELMNLFTWGIKDSDYVLRDDGVAVYPEGVTTPSEQVWHTSDYALGNTFLLHPWDPQGPDFRENAKIFHDNCPVSPLFGLTIDTSNVETIYANISSVMDQYRASMLSGLYTEEMYTELMGKLETAGLREYIAELQTQCDAFLAQ